MDAFYDFIRFRWEFMRRDPEYREAWDRVKLLRKKAEYPYPTPIKTGDFDVRLGLHRDAEDALGVADVLRQELKYPPGTIRYKGEEVGVKTDLYYITPEYREELEYCKKFDCGGLMISPDYSFDDLLQVCNRKRYDDVAGVEGKAFAELVTLGFFFRFTAGAVKIRALEGCPCSYFLKIDFDKINSITLLRQYIDSFLDNSYFLDSFRYEKEEISTNGLIGNDVKIIEANDLLGLNELALGINFDEMVSLEILKDRVEKVINHYYERYCQNKGFKQKKVKKKQAYSRNYELILEVGDLRSQGFSYSEIVDKISHKSSWGDKYSARATVRNFCRDYEGLINGGWRQLSYP